MCSVTDLSKKKEDSLGHKLQEPAGPKGEQDFQGVPWPKDDQGSAGVGFKLATDENDDVEKKEDSEFGSVARLQSEWRLWNKSERFAFYCQQRTLEWNVSEKKTTIWTISI